MKYKVGDKVRIKSREWYDSNKNKYGDVDFPCCTFTAEMSEMCGKVYQITCTDTDGTYFANGYWLLEDFIEVLVSDEKPLISTKLIKDIAEAIKTHNLSVSISENEGKLIIEPLKVEEDLPIDTPCMCSCSMQGQLAWFVRFYAGKGQTWWDLGKSHNETRKVDWNCIIPWDKFNPNNIEESLKYNIVNK